MVRTLVCLWLLLNVAVLISSCGEEGLAPEKLDNGDGHRGSLKSSRHNEQKKRKSNFEPEDEEKTAHNETKHKKSRHDCSVIKDLYREHFSKKIVSPDELAKRYVLVREFTGGKGGARIFLVRDANDSHREKVIKIFPKETFKDTIAKSESGRELYISCTLDGYPWFPRFYEYGLTTAKNPFMSSRDLDDYLFMVIEFVKGKSLLELSKSNEKNALTYAHARSIMGQLTSGIEKAFSEKGFIHFDLHPHNIIVTNDAPQLIKIIDFGLSTVTEFHAIAGVDAKKIAMGDAVAADRPLSLAVISFGQHMMNNAGAFFKKGAYAAAMIKDGAIIRHRYRGGDDVQFINMLIYVFRNFFAKDHIKKRDFGSYCTSISHCKKQFFP